MKWSERKAITDAANVRRTGIADEKNQEYTNEAEDTLANFKVIAHRLGLDPLTTLAVYVNKHFDSVNTFVMRLQRLVAAGDFEGAKALVNAGEGIQSRLDDVRNYMDLAECLLIEAELLPRQGQVHYNLDTGEFDVG